MLNDCRSRQRSTIGSSICRRRPRIPTRIASRPTSSAADGGGCPDLALSRRERGPVPVLPSPFGRWAGGEGRELGAEDSDQQKDALTLALSRRERGLATRPLTYHRTATRPFETAYWRTIARLANGQYVNKDNADCVRDPITQAAVEAPPSRPGGLGDYLLDYYRRTIDDGRHDRAK